MPAHQILLDPIPLFRLTSAALTLQAVTASRAGIPVTAYRVRVDDHVAPLEVLFAAQTGNASFDWEGQYRLIDCHSIEEALWAYFGAPIQISHGPSV